jgi:hypothetical protein
MTDKGVDMLDDLFAQARAMAPQPSDDLTRRVLAAVPQPVRPKPRQRAAVWPQLVAMIGGWPAFGGLAVAAMAGVWVGIAPPAPVADYAQTLLGGGTISIGLFGADVDFETGELIDG